MVGATMSDSVALIAERLPRATATLGPMTDRADLAGAFVTGAAILLINERMSILGVALVAATAASEAVDLFRLAHELTGLLGPVAIGLVIRSLKPNEQLNGG